MVTVSQSSLVTILKELAKAKQMISKLRKSVQQTLSKQSPTPSPTVTKPTVMPKPVTTKCLYW